MMVLVLDVLICLSRNRNFERSFGWDSADYAFSKETTFPTLFKEKIVNSA